jgi:hypothetical protein
MQFLEILRNLITRHYSIQIPRSHAPGTGNALGAMIAQNRCPLCKDKRGFYRGKQPGTLYCGNSDCRMGFTIVNYGPGRVAAHLTEHGPDQLYADGWGKDSRQFSRGQRRETLPDET